MCRHVYILWCRLIYMSNESKYSGIKEFWTISTKRGPRAYYYGAYPLMRSMPLPYKEALLLEATGQAVRTTKPEWLG
jgi:hypothetical protein